jgi:hypothetical protein
LRGNFKKNRALSAQLSRCRLVLYFPYLQHGEPSNVSFDFTMNGAVDRGPELSGS